MKTRIIKVDSPHLLLILAFVGAFSFLVPEPLKYDACLVILPIIPFVFQWPGLSLGGKESIARNELLIRSISAVLGFMWLAGIMIPGIAREYGPRWLEQSSFAAEVAILDSPARTLNAVTKVPLNGTHFEHSLYVATVGQGVAAMMRGADVFRAMLDPMMGQWELWSLCASIALLLVLSFIQLAVYTLKE